VRAMMTLDVRYYQSASGVRPVEDYLASLEEQERARLLAVFADIATHGLDGSGAVARHIDGKLWELKVSRHRVFYVVIEGPVMVLLHAYKKQGQKAPKRELEVAQVRMKEVLR
jgi:phage-related protein